MPTALTTKKAEIAQTCDLAHAIHQAIPSGTPEHIAVCAAITYLCSFAEVVGSEQETAALMRAAAKELEKSGARFGRATH